ncbi:MAG: KGK family protein [Pleurocapsa minor HA4230-MV1]|nr:KGK family protein [Pleurocapsa minor HA4230-MV1]
MREGSKLIISNEVISIDNQEDNIVISHSTYIAEEFFKQLRSRLGCHNKDQWTNEGVPCKILSPNQNWQKGKIRICLQFIPDRSESVLDDIRENK